MELTYTELQNKLQNKEVVDMFNIVLVAEYPSPIWPEYKGLVRIADEKKEEREKTLCHAIECYGFLVPRNTIFRLNFLGELIKRYYKSERSDLIADLCLINGVHYSPFKRNADGTIVQI